MVNNNMKKNTKRWLIIAGGVLSLIAVGIVGAGLYFFQVAVVPSPKAFLSKDQKITKASPLYTAHQWYQRVDKQRWHETSTSDDLKLDAYYIPAAKATKKTAVIAHGFMGDKDKMYQYAYMFNQLGYNVLLPDDRAHGDSQGKYIGYGWLDKGDYVKWIKQVIAKNGSDSQIVMFGTSMGGATTMMVSGEKNVPVQVKAYIEDCGYTSVYDEIAYEAQELYHLPKWPMVLVVSAITKLKAGYTFGQASSLNQVKKNHKPMLFIHGSEDHFVPTKMVYPLYKATKGPKELLLVKGAAHAKAYETDPQLYTRTVREFLARYID